MLGKIVTLYRKAEMGVVNALSGMTEKVMEETGFYDIGYMQTQIGRIQKEINRIENEIKAGIEIEEYSDYGKKHRSELMGQRERLLHRMVFLATNSFRNLDDCVKLADGHGFVFMRCVQGLREYHAGHKDEAFQIMEAYYRQYGSVEGHFLVNKVFGLLLAEKGMHQKAASFLTYALQFIPDDIETLEALQLCYERTKETERREVVGEVLAVLGDKGVCV